MAARGAALLLALLASAAAQAFKPDDTTIRTAVTAWLTARSDAEALYGSINGWDVSEVTDMVELFVPPPGSSATDFNDDIGNWDVSKVTDMSRMFQYATRFNKRLQNWDPRAVTSMSSMFQGAISFTQDLGWCLHGSVDVTSAFRATLCEATSCGVDTQDAGVGNGLCPFPTPAPTPAPTITSIPTVTPFPSSAPTRIPTPKPTQYPTVLPTSDDEDVKTPWDWRPYAAGAIVALVLVLGFYGGKCLANCGGKQWSGVVTAVRAANGRVVQVLDRKEAKRFYDVAYDDGETETRIPAKQLRRRQGPPERKVPLIVGEPVRVKSEKRARKEKALKIAKKNRERNAKRYARKRASFETGRRRSTKEREAEAEQRRQGCCGKMLVAVGLLSVPEGPAGPESPYARKERLRREREAKKKTKKKVPRKMAAQVEKQEEEVVDHVALAAELTASTVCLCHYLPWYQFDREKAEVGFHWTLKDQGFRFGGDGAIAAHWSPLIGPYDGRDRRVVRYHLALMRETGIRGVVCRWFGTQQSYYQEHNLRAADVLLEECCKADMRFTICWDDRGAFAASGQATWRGSTSSTASVIEQEASLVEVLAKDFTYLRDHYFDKSAFVRHGVYDEPVICLLGPTKITKARVWEEAITQVFPDLKLRPKLLAMAGSPVQDAHAVDVGLYSWVPRKMQPQCTLRGVGDYVDDFYEDPAAFMGSAFPSYRDFYAEGNDGPRRGFIGPHRGKTLDAGIDSAARWKPPFLQLISWNNWQEGTMLEPSAEERFLRLLRLQKRLVGRDDASAEAAFVAIQAQAAEMFRTERAEIPELSDAGPPPAEHMFNLALAFPEAVEERDPDRLEKAKRPFATERTKEKVIFVAAPSVQSIDPTESIPDSFQDSDAVSSSWLSVSLFDGEDAPPPEGFFEDLGGYSEPDSDEEEAVSPLRPSQDLDGFTTHRSRSSAVSDDASCVSEAPAPAPYVPEPEPAPAPEPAQAPAPAAHVVIEVDDATSSRFSQAEAFGSPGSDVDPGAIWADYEEEHKEAESPSSRGSRRGRSRGSSRRRSRSRSRSRSASSTEEPLFEAGEGPSIDQCIKERLEELRIDQHKGLEVGKVYGYVPSVEKGTLTMPRPLKFKRNTDILKTEKDVEEIANLAIVCQVCLEECEDFGQPLTITVESHLRGQTQVHAMTLLQKRAACGLARRRAKCVARYLVAHGIPRVNVVAAGVGVSDTPGLVVFLDACSREAALKAAMMPAYAPSVARRADPRKVKRTLPWQKSALRQAQDYDMRPEAHVVEVRPPSSGYGKVAPSKNLVHGARSPTRGPMARRSTKRGDLEVLNKAGRAPLRMPTSGLWTPQWPPREEGADEDARLKGERARRVADARADTTARSLVKSRGRQTLSPKPKPPTPPTNFEPLPLASHDPDSPTHAGLVAVAARTARRWNGEQRLQRSRNVVGLSREILGSRDVDRIAPPKATLLPRSVRSLRYVLGGRQEPFEIPPQRSPPRADTAGRRVAPAANADAASRRFMSTTHPGTFGAGR